MTPTVKSLLPALCLLFVSAVQAQVSLKDEAQLVTGLAASPQCCVIDGRAAANRKSEPLEHVLLWRTDLKISSSGPVVVIADREQDTLDIANALGRKHPGQPIFAVKGGVATWKGASSSLLPAAQNVVTSGPVSFVIPANTCEQGTPLQVLRPDKK